MEDLREKVYECTLAVEAHMIVDLLARAGISARVDGEFLAGAGGDLPLGSTIKVRVDPARATEAREVIDEWEKTQPPEPTPPAPRPPWKSPLWFVVGGVSGFALAVLMMRTPSTDDGVDYDGDGRLDVTYHYAGNRLESTEEDRNRDGKIDARWRHDLHGFAKSFEADSDFDGYFEWQYDVVDDQFESGRLDLNADGRPDVIVHYQHGVAQSADIYEETGSRIVAQQHFNLGHLSWIELDRDGDGHFDRIDVDRYGLPK